VKPPQTAPSPNEAAPVSAPTTEAGSGTGLVVSGLSAGYGRMRVVHDISVTVPPGGWIGIIGRNGVGKTTTLAAICGLRHGRFAGTVELDGVGLSKRSPSQITQEGLVFVPDGHRIFPSLTVAENLAVAGAEVPGGRRVTRAGIDRVIELFPPLERFLSKQAGLLSGGEQQMLSIGQALMLHPRILVLDEPSSALAPLVVGEIYAALQKLRAEGVGLLVTEQDVARSLNSVDTCLVMDGGQVVLSGPAAELSSDNRVSEIVLGRRQN
jgi:branched-chain amino acid transport system ATP-binding protein